MAVSWYVEKQGQQLGPFSSAELKGLAATGQLKPHDSVRRADQPKIVAAGKIKGLFPVGEPLVRPKTTPPPLPTTLKGTANRVGPSPTPEGDQERFEVRPNARRNATLATMGCAVFTFGGFWLMASGEQVFAGLLAVLFFGGGGVYAIPKLLRRPVSLVLSREGIEQRTQCGEATISWEDVEQIGLVSLHGTKLVGLRLARYDGYLRSMTDELASHMNRFGLPLMRGLSTIASRLEAPSVLGLWSVLEGRPDTTEALKGFGKVGSLAEAMSWSRQHFGYDITFGWADLDRPAAEFVTLLERYRNANGSEPKPIRDVPPPLPSSKGYLDGIGEGLDSLTEASKAAARLAAAQARKAHLVNVTLRAAYLDLGKDIYASSRFRDEFADLFSEIVEIERQIGQFSAARTQDAQPKGLADRASKAATSMKATAQSKALSLKKDSLLRRLGQFSFAKHGDRSGPGSQVQRIADCLSGVEEVDQEILRWSNFGQGRLITSRRILAGSIGVVVVAIALSTLLMMKGNDTSRNGDVSGMSFLTAGRSPERDESTTGRRADPATTSATEAFFQAYPASTTSGDFKGTRLIVTGDMSYLADLDDGRRVLGLEITFRGVRAKCSFSGGDAEAVVSTNGPRFTVEGSYAGLSGSETLELTDCRLVPDSLAPQIASLPSIEQFLTMVGRSGEVKNPRKGLPILVQSKYELRAVLGEPTNVLSSVHEFGRGTHEILDYACSDGRVQLRVTYDLAGAWIKEITPIRY